MYILDKNGNVLLHESSPEPRMSYTPENRALFQRDDVIVTHSHPTGTPFSIGDLHFAIRDNVAELRLVGFYGKGEEQRRVTYSVRRLEAGWPKYVEGGQFTRKSTAGQIGEVYRQTDDELTERYLNGEISSYDATYFKRHEAVKRLAEDWGFDYSWEIEE